MRVKLTNPRKFFIEVQKGKTIKKFCKENDLTYDTVKKWRQGKYLIPKEIFDKFIPIFKNKEYWLSSSKFLEDNWAAHDSGIASIRKLTKSQLLKKMRMMRIKAGQNVKKIKIKINNNFLEFYGALMGDGCLSKINIRKNSAAYYIIISGHKILDRDYHKNYLIPLIKKEFSLEFKIKPNNKNNSMLTQKMNKDLFLKLNKFGFPVGKKGQRLIIPKKFIKLRWNLIKNIIRGLFDTDGCIYARKDENYKYPHIKITSKSKKLIFQLYKILRERGYPIRITKHEDEVILKGIDNTKRWMADIGSNNRKHLYKYDYWLKNGFLPANIWADSLSEE